MDRRIHYKIVVDCETAPCDRSIDEVTPINMLAYDIGWVVTDRRGNVYASRSFVNANVFLDEKDLMHSAYYAHKIPEYWEDIKSGKRILTSFYNIRMAFLADCNLYNVQQIYAHNMHFDYSALNNTQRWLTKSKYRYFFPYGAEICDTLKLAKDLIAPMKKYRKFCEENGYITKAGNVRLTAEILYRFISGDEEFKEEHKGLDDCLAEKEILAYCYSKHKKMDGRLWAAA